MGSPFPGCQGIPGFGWVYVGAADYRIVRRYVESPRMPLGTLAWMDADLTPGQVADLLEQDAIELIDVRQGHEYDAGRIAGARHLELTELADHAGELDPARPLVFYCRSGGRSAMATQAFRGAGFDAHNMAGGLLAWETAGLPMEPEGGYVAE